MHARLGQRRYRHQGRALRHLAPAAVGFHLAGVIGDLAHRDTRRGLAGIVRADAHQRTRIRRLVAYHRRIAERRGIAAVGTGRRADAASKRQRREAHHERLGEKMAGAGDHLDIRQKCRLPLSVAVWLPLLTCVELTITVFHEPSTVTLSALPIAVAEPPAVAVPALTPNCVP